MYLSIGNFAKIMDITTETLRHYDRIGLLKPIHIDKITGYRYYSIMQQEQISIIKELRYLGMSLDYIKGYFDNKSLSQSLDMLINQRLEILKKIKELKLSEKHISEKILYLQQVPIKPILNNIVIKDFSARKIVTLDEDIENDDYTVYYVASKFMKILKNTSLVLTNNYGSILFPKKTTLFLLTSSTKNISKKYIKTIPEGRFACILRRGDYTKREDLSKILKKLHKEGYKINNNILDGGILEITQVDIAVTNVTNEFLFELQIPIK